MLRGVWVEVTVAGEVYRTRTDGQGVVRLPVDQANSYAVRVMSAGGLTPA